MWEGVGICGREVMMEVCGEGRVGLGEGVLSTFAPYLKTWVHPEKEQFYGNTPSHTFVLFALGHPSDSPAQELP